MCAFPSQVPGNRYTHKQNCVNFCRFPGSCSSNGKLEERLNIFYSRSFCSNSFDEQLGRGDNFLDRANSMEIATLLRSVYNFDFFSKKKMLSREICRYSVDYSCVCMYSYLRTIQILQKLKKEIAWTPSHYLFAKQKKTEKKRPTTGQNETSLSALTIICLTRAFSFFLCVLNSTLLWWTRSAHIKIKLVILSQLSEAA